MAVEEVLCGAFGQGETPTCETCLKAGCGWTDDDGDCLESCATVNDGAACLELQADQDATDVCGSGTSGTGTSGSGTSGTGKTGSAMALSLAFLLVVMALIHTV